MSSQTDSTATIGPATDAPDNLPELETLYREHARPLLAFLSARCRRSDLDDLAQEVWLKVARSLDDRFRGGNFRAWLFQIARNALVDFHRRRRPVEAVENVEVADPVLRDPAACLLDAERQAALEGCLSRLSEREQCVFRHICAGTTYDVIQGACGCDHNGAYKALHAAKQKLRECLERTFT